MVCYFPAEKAKALSFGGDGGGEPHVPISNTTVKPSSADGTWTAGSWESRTSPSGIEKKYLLQKLSDDDKIISCQEKSNILYLENWIRKYMKHPKRIEFNKRMFV